MIGVCLPSDAATVDDWRVDDLASVIEGQGWPCGRPGLSIDHEPDRKIAVPGAALTDDHGLG
jgi:hypothetical protein